MRTTKKLLEWDRTTICRELGMDSRTVGKRLAELGSGERKTYSTLEVFKAFHGDIDAERLRKERFTADLKEIELAEKRGELVPVREIAAAVSRGIEAVKGRILGAANMEREDKEKILLACKDCFESAFLAVPEAEPPRPAAPDISAEI